MYIFSFRRIRSAKGTFLSGGFCRSQEKWGDGFLYEGVCVLYLILILLNAEILLFFLSAIQLFLHLVLSQTNTWTSFSGAGCRGGVFAVTLAKVGCGHFPCASGEEFQNRLH